MLKGIVKGASTVPDKPVVPVFMAGRIVREGNQYLASSGRPALPTGERAAAVLAVMAERGSGKVLPARDWAVPDTGKGPAGSFLEPEQVRFLSQRGFPLPAYRYVTSQEELLDVAEAVPFPVVMKIVSPDILHKSDVGGVILGIRNAEELEGAWQDMKSRLSKYDVRGVMVYEQVGTGHECILGAKRDADFGPVVLAGSGGVMSELMKDISMRIAP